MLETRTYNNQEFLTYNSLKIEVQKKGIKTRPDYLKEREFNRLWIANPWTSYGKEYSDSDFFGINFLSYEELKQEVQKLNIRSVPEYMEESKNHNEWVNNPWIYYSEQYSCLDFFGDTLLSYEKLKRELRDEGIDSMLDYQFFQRRHDNWPSQPKRVYKEYSYEDFFGRNR